MTSVLERINDILSSIGAGVMEAVHDWTWTDTLGATGVALLLYGLLQLLSNAA